MKRKYLLAAVLFVVTFIFCKKVVQEAVSNNDTAFGFRNSEWVDSLVSNMTIEDKVGQLIMARVANPDTAQYRSLFSWVAQGKVGGVMLETERVFPFSGAVDSCHKLTKIPLFIAADQQVLLNNNFDNVAAFPSFATLSSLAGDSVRNALAELFVNQCRHMGVNFIMAPKVEDRASAKRIYLTQFFRGSERNFASTRLLRMLNDHHILSIADQLDAQALFSIDSASITPDLLAPYKLLTKHGVSGFKVGKEYFRSEFPKNKPYAVLRSFLAKDLQFRGLIVGEAGAEDKLEPLVRSGVDMIVVEGDAARAHDFLMRYIEEGFMSIPALDDKVKKILIAKQWMRKPANPGKQLNLPGSVLRMQANANEPVIPFAVSTGILNAVQHFENPQWPYWIRKIYEESAILIQNPGNLIPFTGLEAFPVRIVELNDHRFDIFRYWSGKYTTVVQLSGDLEHGNATFPIENINQKAPYIVVLDHELLRAHNSFTRATLDALASIAGNTPAVVVYFGPLSTLPFFSSNLAILHFSERNQLTEKIAAEILFGAVAASGKLPVKINEGWELGTGATTAVIRLKYSSPEEAGYDPVSLQLVDSIVINGIQAGAYPGAQVLMAKAGKIFYDKTFGFHTYQQEKPVMPTDLYDLASVTKAAATALAAMKAFEEKKFQLGDKLRRHLELDNDATIKNVKIRRFLTHQSGMPPNMPIGRYLYSRIDCHYFCDTPSDSFSLKVMDSLYFNNKYLNAIWDSMQHMEREDQRSYQYSDVNFNIIQKLVETTTSEKLDAYVERNYYQPLGLHRTLFNPRSRFPLSEIVPSQIDQLWRKRLVHGYVHDESAALQGGVGGNAGLFSTADNLAVLFQMLLNGGAYGGKTYLRPRTIELFTNASHGNHRGLGFDKPGPYSLPGYAFSASDRTYGHTGFTGTCVWVDPQEDLIFVFLSNRTYPDRTNLKISRMEIRQRANEVAYRTKGSFVPVFPTLPSMEGSEGAL